MSQRFRILHCLRAPVGGLFRHVLDLSSEQSARGHDVGLIVDSTSANPLTEARLANAAPNLKLGITRVPMSRTPGLGDAAACRAVADAARRLQADVLHGHGAKGGAYARIATRILKFEGRRVVSIYTPHGGSLHFPPGSPQGVLFIGLEKVLARVTDGLIFESDYARRVYEKRVGKSLAPSRVITNALQPADFAAYAPPPGAADFLFVGELRRLKGVDLMIGALAEVARVRPVQALIVGAGPDGAEFELLTATLGLEKMITFTGAMPAAEAFRRGRCIVVPSRAESLPYIVLEAAAAELPLIATNAGGIPEIVRGTDTQLLPAGDVNALARAMHGFLDEPQAAIERAKRLRKIVAERFAIEATTTSVLDVYAALLGR